METFFFIVSIIFGLYLTVEIGTAIYIYRNRKTLAPRIQSFIRSSLNLQSLENSLKHSISEQASRISFRLDELDKKVTYTAKHTQFERAQLRTMGILPPKAPKQADPAQPNNVIPLNRN